MTYAEVGRNIAILLTINATGDQFISSHFAFPQVRLNRELKKDALLGSVFDGQQSGCIIAEGLLIWLKILVKRVRLQCEKAHYRGTKPMSFLATFQVIPKNCFRQTEQNT